MATEQTTLDGAARARPGRACPHCGERVPDTVWPQHVRSCEAAEVWG